MKTFLGWLLLCGFFVSTNAAGGPQVGPEDDRSSAFVAGTASADEAFGHVEGLALIGLAAAAILAVFALLFVAGRTDIDNRGLLGRIAERLAGRGGGDV